MTMRDEFEATITKLSNTSAMARIELQKFGGTREGEYMDPVVAWCWDMYQAQQAALFQSGADAWQPIDSAPKDGTAVLCCQPSEGWIMVLRCYSGMWSDGNFPIIYPTHWQPLPAPPRTQAAQKPAEETSCE